MERRLKNNLLLYWYIVLYTVVGYLLDNLLTKGLILLVSGSENYAGICLDSQNYTYSKTVVN